MTDLQSGAEWHAFRALGIGSSDAPAIMKVSPWCSPYKLWLRKTGQLGEQPSNWAMERGKVLEASVRDRFNLIQGTQYEPVTLVHPEHTFVRASLDGYYDGSVIEIKCPGEADHQKCKDGNIPEKYLPQVMHQMLVTNSSHVHYISFYKDDLVTLTIDRSAAYIDDLFIQEKIFWHNHVLRRVAPALSDTDYKVLVDDSLSALAERYRTTSLERDRAEERMEELRKEMLASDLIDHPRVEINGVQIIKSSRLGSVDYSKLVKDMNLNVEEYRKPGSEYFTLKVMK